MLTMMTHLASNIELNGKILPNHLVKNLISVLLLAPQYPFWPPKPKAIIRKLPTLFLTPTSICFYQHRHPFPLLKERPKERKVMHTIKAYRHAIEARSSASTQWERKFAHLSNRHLPFNLVVYASTFSYDVIVRRRETVGFRNIMGWNTKLLILTSGKNQYFLTVVHDQN